MVYGYETFPEQFKVSAKFMGIAIVVKGLGERISTKSTRIDFEVFKILEIFSFSVSFQGHEKLKLRKIHCSYSRCELLLPICVKHLQTSFEQLIT